MTISQIFFKLFKVNYQKCCYCAMLSRCAKMSPSSKSLFVFALSVQLQPTVYNSSVLQLRMREAYRFPSVLKRQWNWKKRWKMKKLLTAWPNFIIQMYIKKRVNLQVTEWFLFRLVTLFSSLAKSLLHLETLLGTVQPQADESCCYTWSSLSNSNTNSNSIHSFLIMI